MAPWTEETELLCTPGQSDDRSFTPWTNELQCATAPRQLLQNTITPQTIASHKTPWTQLNFCDPSDTVLFYGGYTNIYWNSPFVTLLSSHFIIHRIKNDQTIANILHSLHIPNTNSCYGGTHGTCMSVISCQVS